MIIIEIYTGVTKYTIKKSTMVDAVQWLSSHRNIDANDLNRCSKITIIDDVRHDESIRDSSRSQD